VLLGAKSYDVLDIAMPDGRELKVYFDISDFYGKGAEPPALRLPLRGRRFHKSLDQRISAQE
jgi:hypothetical protein